MKKIEFNKNEKWDCFTFYNIYEDKGEKYIKFVAQFDRCDKGKEYLSWEYTPYPDNMCEKISKLTEWDVYYGLDKLINENKINLHSFYFEPDIVFNYANKHIKGLKGDGSIHLDLLKINKNTPCGDYYGM